jgi:hypothetical protein
MSNSYGRARQRRSGFQDFLDGFNGAFETGSRIGRQIETAGVMNEKPEEVQLSDEEYAAQAAAGPVAPNTQYNGKTYQRPIGERELMGLRTNRLADVAAKYGDAEGSLRLRKQAGDMEWEDESRSRQRIGYGREDEAYGAKQKGLRILSEVDPNKPESFIDASNKLMANGQAPEAAAARSQATETKAWQTARQNEGFDTADQAIRAGTPFMEKFNAVGNVKLDAEPTVTRTKDKTGREVISVTGTMDNGKPFKIDDWDAYVTGRLPLEKRQAVAASLRSEGREVDKIGEETRRWNEGHKLDVLKTNYAGQTAKAARDAASEARQARIDLQKVEQARKDREELNAAGDEIDKYIMSNALVMDVNDKGEEVVNKTRAAEFREFINAHPTEGVDLLKKMRVDPRGAKSDIDRSLDQALLHKEAEKQAGKKLPFFSTVEHGKQTAADSEFGGGKKIGLGAAAWNTVFNGKDEPDVVRYGDVVLDYQSLIESPNGERIARLLSDPRTKEKAPAPVESRRAPGQSTVSASNAEPSVRVQPGSSEAAADYRKVEAARAARAAAAEAAAAANDPAKLAEEARQRRLQRSSLNAGQAELINRLYK